MSLILAVLATYAVTELVAESKVFEPVRHWFFDKAAFGMKGWAYVADLISCPFCLSWWVAWPLLILCNGEWPLVMTTTVLAQTLAVIGLTQLARKFVK